MAKKVGRPKIEIDKDQFEKLCSLGCTCLEIAGWFQCTDDTIVNFCKETYGMNFQQTFDVFSARAKISLRRSQLKLAETNPTMAIWLGKQLLGQTDNIEVKTDNNINVINDVPNIGD